MLTKKFLLMFLAIILPLNAFSAETNQEDNKGDLRANFKRVSLDLSSTDVSNATQYQNSPNSQLSSDSQTVVKGVFDFILEYEQPQWQWNNSLFMEYGKTSFKKADGEKSSNENADKILLTTDYMRKTWRYWDADVGPFVNIGYQTEFSANEDAPRNKVIRGKYGIKLFNGKYFKELYAAAVGEIDMTYDENDKKSAWEVGLRYEYPLRDGVKFQLEGYYRDYITYSRYVGTDFKYELNFTSRMDVKISDKLSLGPYISYLKAQSREARNAGSNFMVGVSLSYSDLFDI